MEFNDFLSKLASWAADRNAEIAGNIQGREALLKKVPIDLSVARSVNNALKISVPFKSVTVEAATDSTCKIYLGLGDNTLDALQDAKELKANDSFDFERFVGSAFLFWDAQAGKSLKLVFSTTGSFKPGSQISQISGGLSISEGSALSSAKLGSLGTAATVAVPDSAATVILPADTDRKNNRLYTDADIWIGDASVAVNARGIPITTGWFEWPSTSILYAIAVSGTANIYGNDTR